MARDEWEKSTKTKRKPIRSLHHMEDGELNQNQLEQLPEGSSNRVIITKEALMHSVTSCKG